MSWQRKAVPQIAKLVYLSEKRVRYRIKAWNAAGLKALERHKPSGRPKRLPDHLGERIVELAAQQKPQDYGWNESQWTPERLADAVILNGWTDTICAESVRLALKEEKISYRRLKRWEPSGDPACEHKKARRHHYLNKSDNPNWGVVFMDEMDNPDRCLIWKLLFGLSNMGHIDATERPLFHKHCFRLFPIKSIYEALDEKQRRG